MRKEKGGGGERGDGHSKRERMEITARLPRSR